MALELVTLPAAFGLRNVSPFCVKAEMLLTHLGEDFTKSEILDPRKAPKGKLPYLVVDGGRIADSELIALHLDERSGGAVFGTLSPEANARGLAFTRLVEDHLYWLMVASRWLDDAWWPNVVEGFFGFVPAPLRGFAAGAARRQVRRTIELQGLGRHDRGEQLGFARRDLSALNVAVRERDFLVADAPCVHDFAVAGFLATLYDQQPPTWINPIAEEFPDLKAYTERVQAAVGIYARYHQDEVAPR